MTPNTIDRTAFIFNINDNTILYQMNAYQSFNHINYGPTFGASGYDLHIDLSLERGSAYPYSYSSDSANIFNQYNQTLFQIASFEVYAVRPTQTDPANPVPAPTGLLLGLIGSASLGLFYRVRRSSNCADSLAV